MLVAIRAAAGSTVRPSARLEEFFYVLDSRQWPVTALDSQYTFDAALVGTDVRIPVDHVGNILSRKNTHDQFREEAGIDVLIPQTTLRLRTRL